MSHQVINADVMEGLRGIESGAVQCCVTSPPYFGLRDYGHHGQIGLEPTMEEYVQKMVTVFREVKRVLRDDGALWLNLGDSYSSGGRTEYVADPLLPQRGGIHRNRITAIEGVKPKNLIGIPWRVAFALQADGWYLRQDIIWHKPNPMPESVTDRCTKAHEYIFLLSKSARYFYDRDAISEKCVQNEIANGFRGGAYTGGETYDNSNGGKRKNRGNIRLSDSISESKMPGALKHTGLHLAGQERFPGMRNRRSVWTIATRPFKCAHFATFPPQIPRLCILAGSREGDTILDPFGGSGTVASVAKNLNRQSISIEINATYTAMIIDRIRKTESVLFG